MRPGLRRDTVAAMREGLPVALLLALTVGLAVAIGANLSNATPSKAQPFGWPGAANFEGGVATVRSELILATTLPALLLGLRAVPRDTSRRPLAAIASGLVLVPAALLASTLIGASVAARSPPDAYLAFWVAHSLLALSCFSLGFLAGAATLRHGAVAGLASWSVFAVLMDDSVRWQLFRKEGYDNLAAGLLPNWFYVMQVLSPVATYRALLIVWQPGFRDWLEHAALDKATLPGWLSPAMLSSVMLLLWVALPLGIAALVLHLRARRASSASTLRALAPAAAAAGILTGRPRRRRAPMVDVAAERPHPTDRPEPLGSMPRPRLNADQRVETMRAAIMPPPRRK